MKNKNLSKRRSATSVQWEGAQCANRWLKRLLVIQRCPGMLDQTPGWRNQRSRTVTASDAKFIGYKRTSAGEMFALYAIAMGVGKVNRSMVREKSIPGQSGPVPQVWFSNKTLGKCSRTEWPALNSRTASARIADSLSIKEKQ